MTRNIEINDCDEDKKPDSESANLNEETNDDCVNGNIEKEDNCGSEPDSAPVDDNQVHKLQILKENFEKLKVQVNDLQGKNKEYLDHLQRMKAEFDNYKKRIAREKADSIRFANSLMSEKLLPVIDNLQRGLKHAADNSLNEQLLEGFVMVEKQLLDVLSEFGVTPFDSLDKPFDPEFHEPLYTIERDDIEENMVIEEIEKGYLIHDKILRASKVAVSRKP